MKKGKFKFFEMNSKLWESANHVAFFDNIVRTQARTKNQIVSTLFYFHFKKDIDASLYIAIGLLSTICGNNETHLAQSLIISYHITRYHVHHRPTTLHNVLLLKYPKQLCISYTISAFCVHKTNSHL